MAKAKQLDVPPAEAAPGESGPIMANEYFALPEDVRRRRAQRVYEKAMALKGKIHLNIDIDELRGSSVAPITLPSASATFDRIVP